MNETKNLMNKEVFAQCKKGFKLINCARGGIINEQDLFDALNDGTCGGAALDVFDEVYNFFKTIHL
jgi:D-3-phosphoglycerate dehydrogenase